MLLPLVPVAAYNYFLVRGLEAPSALSVSPWYPVMLVLGLGLVLLLPTGLVLGYFLRRPASTLGRFGVGVAAGSAILLATLVARL